MGMMEALGEVKKPPKFAAQLCSPCLKQGAVWVGEEGTSDCRLLMGLAQAEDLADCQGPLCMLQSSVFPSTSRREVLTLALLIKRETLRELKR